MGNLFPHAEFVNSLDIALFVQAVKAYDIAISVLDLTDDVHYSNGNDFVSEQLQRTIEYLKEARQVMAEASIPNSGNYLAAVDKLRENGFILEEGDEVLVLYNDPNREDRTGILERINTKGDYPVYGIRFPDNDFLETGGRPELVKRHNDPTTR